MGATRNNKMDGKTGIKGYEGRTSWLVQGPCACFAPPSLPGGYDWGLVLARWAAPSLPKTNQCSQHRWWPLVRLSDRLGLQHAS
jgi:hypothetical protein